MNGNLLSLIIFTQLLSYFSSFGQIAKYSQYNNIAVFANPALTTMADRAEIAFHYRKMNLQEGQGLSMPSLTFVSPVRYTKNAKKKGDSFGAYSIALLQQRAGTNGIFVTTSLGTSFAYKVKLDNKNSISGGIQASYDNFKVDESKITTDNQYQNGYDPGLPTGETFLASNVSTVYLNAGINWHSTDERRNIRHWLGVSASNLNQPRTIFLNSGNRDGRMPMLLTATGGINIVGDKMNKLIWIPSFRYTFQAATSILNTGLEASYQVEKNKLIVGTYYSTASNLFLVMGTEINRLYFSMGYDMNVSGDQESKNSLSSLESHLALRF